MTKQIQQMKQANIQTNKQPLIDTVERVLNLAKLKGATAAEVAASQENGFSINVRLGDVQTLEYHRDKGISITVYFDKQKGSVSTSDISEASLIATVDKACSIAKLTGNDQFAGLADAELMAYNYPDLDLYHPWDISPEDAITFAKSCEALGLDFDKRITNSDGCDISTHEGISVYGNSHGFIGAYPTTAHQFSLMLIASDKQVMQRDYSYTVSRVPELLSSKERVASEAAEKVLRRLNARRIPTQTAPVLFIPELARGLIGNLLSAISGTSQYRKSSFLYNCLGQLVLPDFITLTEKPFIQRGLHSSPFDGEGVRKQERIFVDKGVLQHYLLGSYSARKLGMITTGNAGGISNLQITHSDFNKAALIQQMHTGLIVTELLGQGVNLVTGDYSRGAAGFWVENGEIQFPVEEITIAGNLKEMLKQITFVGNDIDMRGAIQTGSILLEQMTIAGD